MASAYEHRGTRLQVARVARPEGGARLRYGSPGNKDFAHYGGRGIRVCDEWLGPDGFARLLRARRTATFTGRVRLRCTRARATSATACRRCARDAWSLRAVSRPTLLLSRPRARLRGGVMSARPSSVPPAASCAGRAAAPTPPIAFCACRACAHSGS